MKFLKLHRTKFAPVALLSLIALQLAVTTIVLPTKVHADGYNPETRAAAWNVGLALSNCSNDAGWINSDFLGDQSAGDINDGDIFPFSTDLSDANGDVKTVGYLVDGQDDGTIRCQTPEDVVMMFKAIDETPLTFLKAVGIYKINSDNTAYEVKLDSDSARSSAIRKAIEKKYGFNYNKPMPEDMQYAALLSAFNKKCIETEDTDGPAVSIVDSSGNITTKNYVLSGGDNDVVEVGYSLAGDGGGDQKMSCPTVVKQMNKLAIPYQKVIKSNIDDTDTTNDPPAPAAAQENDTTSCESNSGVLGFLLCPALSLVGGALNWVDTQLSRLLEIDRNKYTNSAMYEAWAQFRNIGLTLLIAAMLVMVISTAIGVNFLDAYTVKKAFPRMVVAVIFMLLSWYVCIFLIDVSNVVGKGTLGLMTAPFGQKAQSLTSLFTPSAGGAILQFGGLAILASAFAIQAAAGILFSYFATGLLVMFVAFLVLVARQMFVIVLVLLAPIAIISWIFPGNDKLWKFWWQSFSKLLLMFPIVMALIASGRIFAGVMATTPAAGAEGGLLTPLLKLTAYIIPYAFIPFTFKAAGGVFGNLVGMANDRSRGAFDRLKKGRQKSMSQIGHNAKEGTFVRENGRFSKAVNSRAQRLSHVSKAGLRPSGWKDNIDTAITTTELQDINKMMDDAEYAPIKGDDNVNAAMADWAAEGSTDGKRLAEILSKTYDYGGEKGSGGDAESIAKAVAYATRIRKRMNGAAFEQMAVIQTLAGGTTWGAEEGWLKAARASHGDAAALANMVAKGRSASMNAGRGDVGGNGFGVTMGYAKALNELEANKGTMSAKEYTDQKNDLTNKYHEGVLESQGPGTILHPSMKDKAVKALVPAMRQRLKAAYDSGDQNQVDRELAIMSSLHDELGRTAPNKARIIADEVLNWDPTTAVDAPALTAGAMEIGVPGAAGPTVNAPTIQKQIEARRNASTVFQGTHKEFTSAYHQQAANGYQPPQPLGGTPLGGGPIGGGPIGGNFT